MAASDRAITDLDEIMQCSICANLITTPRSLPCLHTYCEACLQQHIDASVDRQPARETFACPLCMDEVNLPQCGASEFPLNTMVNNTIGVVKSLKEITERNKCQVCTERSPVVHCFDCKRCMCGKCLSFHNRLHEGHMYSDIDHLGFEQICTRTRDDSCKRHQGETLKFFCVSCDETICLNCRQTNHHGPEHHCVDLMQKNKEWKEETKDKDRKLNVIDDEIYTLSDGIRTLIEVETNHRKSMVEKLEQEKRRVEKVFNNLLERVARASDYNLDALQKRQKDIDQRKNLLSNDRKMLKNLAVISRNNDLYQAVKGLDDIIMHHRTKALELYDIDLKTYFLKRCEGNIDAIDALVGEYQEQGVNIKLTRSLLGDVLPVECMTVQMHPTDVTTALSGEIVVGTDDDVAMYSENGVLLRTIPRTEGLSDWWCPIYDSNADDHILISHNGLEGNNGTVSVTYKVGRQAPGIPFALTDTCEAVVDARGLVIIHTAHKLVNGCKRPTSARHPVVSSLVVPGALFLMIKKDTNQIIGANTGRPGKVDVS